MGLGTQNFRLFSCSMVLYVTSSDIVGRKMEWWYFIYDNIVAMDLAVPSSSFMLFDSCRHVITQLCKENKAIHNGVRYLDTLA